LSGSRLLFQHRPIESVVVLMIEGSKEDAEELAEVHVIRRLLEAQAAAVVKVHGELCRETLAEDLDGSRHLFFADFFVFLLLGGCFKPLPRQRGSVEVHEDITQTLHVIPSALLDPQMGVDRRVPGRSREVLVFPVGNMLTRSVVPVLFSKAEVYYEHLVAMTSNPHQEVIRFDVSVDEVFVVNVFDAADHLIREHQNCLHREPSGAEVEEVLQ